MLRVILLTLMLSGCSSLPLGILGGGGPNVAANTQIGKENRQTAFGYEQKTEVGRDFIQKDLSAESVENLTVKNENIPPWVILLLLIGWLLPTPNEIARWVYKLFGKAV